MPNNRFAEYMTILHWLTAGNKCFLCFLGGLSLHLNHLYSIAIGKLRLAIWDTSFWTFWLKFGHKGH